MFKFFFQYSLLFYSVTSFCLSSHAEPANSEKDLMDDSAYLNTMSHDDRLLNSHLIFLDHHLTYAYKRFDVLSEDIQTLMLFLFEAFPYQIQGMDFFTASGVDELHQKLLYDMFMSINIDNQQEVDDLFTLLLKSLFALMQSQGITLDFEVNHRRNILVYLGLFKSNSFNKFLEELFDNEDFEALSMENQIIILYQYVLSYTSLVMIYNEQLDQEYVIDHTPTVINISHYHRKVKKRKGQTPLVGQFVDKYIGREKFFLGVNILSTLAVTIGFNKISSLAFNTEFNLKNSVAQSVATGVLMFGYYVFNKLFSSSKADKKKSKSWGNN